MDAESGFGPPFGVLSELRRGDEFGRIEIAGSRFACMAPEAVLAEELLAFGMGVFDRLSGGEASCEKKESYVDGTTEQDY